LERTRVKRKLTPEEREELRRLYEFSDAARANMQRILDEVGERRREREERRRAEEERRERRRRKWRRLVTFGRAA
jgi:hypothetical protein